MNTCLKCTENSFSGNLRFEAEDNIRSSMSRWKVKGREEFFMFDAI